MTSVSSSAKALVRNLMNANTSERLTSERLVEHDWLIRDVYWFDRNITSPHALGKQFPSDHTADGPQKDISSRQETRLLTHTKSEVEAATRDGALPESHAYQAAPSWLKELHQAQWGAAATGRLRQIHALASGAIQHSTKATRWTTRLSPAPSNRVSSSVLILEWPRRLRSNIQKETLCWSKGEAQPLRTTRQERPNNSQAIHY